MFSANENIVLRQYKRRIIEYVEETIPEDVLDLGTSVLVMQASCKAPGCVPLETLITVVFPSKDSVLPGLVLTKHETTFQTKILLPMAEVTKDDILDALPPAFAGGRQTMERLGLRARDVMLAQITQLFDDQPSRKMMVEYLQKSLQEFLDRDCVAPEYGEPFPDLPSTIAESDEDHSPTISLSENLQSVPQSSGNVVIQRVLDDFNDNGTNRDDEARGTSTRRSAPSIMSRTPSTNDWRRQRAASRQIPSNVFSPSSAVLLSRLQHAPGVRRPACPCCDPDSVSNVVDSMMML